jgi:hypothetical protein
MNVANNNKGYSVFYRKKFNLKTTKTPQKEIATPYANH